MRHIRLLWLVFAGLMQPLLRAGAQTPELVFGKLRYAICDVADKELILRNRINLAHLHCPASAGAYNGLPERAEFERQMSAWQQGATALRAAGVHPITYIAPDMWYGDAEKRTLIFDFYDKRWGQYEDYLGPRPADPLAWAQIQPDGTPIPYVYEGQRGYYWCTNQPACRQYVQGVIKMHVQYGSHGVFFDGPCNHGCYCAECERQFREFLQREYPAAVRGKILGKRTIEEIKLPPDKTNLPLWAAMQRFRCVSLARFLQDMRAFGRRLCPDFLLTNNYCLWAGDALSMIRLGEHPELYAQYVDILFDEAMYGGGPFLSEEGTRFSNSFHYDYVVAAARAGGSSAGGTPKPAVCTFMGVKGATTEAKQPLAWLEIAEAWASQCVKMQQTFRDQAIVDVFTQAGDFQAAHPELFAPAAPLADVGVWISLQQAYADSPHWGLTILRFLNDAGIAYRVLTDYDIAAQSLKGLRCVIVPGAALMSEAQMNALAQYLTKGGAIVAIGDIATKDEYALPREADKRPAFFREAPTEGIRQEQIGKGRLAWLSAAAVSSLPRYTREALPAEMTALVAKAVRWATKENLLLRQAPPSPCEIHLYAVTPTHWHIYLVNYGVSPAGAVHELSDVTFVLRKPAGRRAVSARAYSVRPAEAQIVSVKQQKEQATFVVPRLPIFCIVEVQWR